MSPRTIAHQAPLSMVFSRQEYWSGLPFPSPGHLPDPGIECESPVSSVLQVDYLPLTYQGSPKKIRVFWVLIVFILSKIGKFFLLCKTWCTTPRGTVIPVLYFFFPAHVKIYYTGKYQSLGIKQGGPSAGKWVELPITKSPKIVHFSVGHDGSHALLVAEDGSIFFTGSASKGEDGESSEWTVQ